MFDQSGNNGSNVQMQNVLSIGNFLGRHLLLDPDATVSR